MANYKVVKATHEHAEYIAQNMREADAQEIWYQAASTPRRAMQHCMRSEIAYTCLVDDVPAFMFGVNSQGLLGNRGNVWMLGTDVIEKIRFRRFELELMDEYVKHMLEGFDAIENHVYDGNKTSIKWLKFLGFEMDDPAPYGMYSMPFRHFEMRAE